MCRVKLSFGTRALIIKVPYLLVTCLLSCDYTLAALTFKFTILEVMIL